MKTYKEKFISKYGKEAYERKMERKRRDAKIKPKTAAERKRAQVSREINFDNVNLHLISDKNIISGEVNFRFESKPHKEDIYFNFYGLDYYHDVYEISPSGNIQVHKSKPYWMGLIRNYIKENPTVKIIDKCRIEKKYEEVPWSVSHYRIIVNDEKTANKISDLCRRYCYAMDVEGRLKLPFNTETRDEMEDEINKKAAREKQRHIDCSVIIVKTCPECGKKYKDTKIGRFPYCDTCYEKIWGSKLTQRNTNKIPDSMTCVMCKQTCPFTAFFNICNSCIEKILNKEITMPDEYKRTEEMFPLRTRYEDYGVKELEQ